MLGYRFVSWLLRTLPPGPTGAVLGLGSQASYLLWPTKRAWSNRNFGHVLGLPPDHPRVRRVALRAYREYGRYLVELMRVPFMPEDQVIALMEPLDPAALQRIRDETPKGGIIVTAAHVGNNDVIGAAIAHLGLPLNVVADNSAFPELFEHLRRQREQWHATLIPWRNLRAIFGVLRRRELLGLLVDWGYRSDGIPVRLFDAWTTLPAGPATLAAKTSSRILPAITARQADGRLRVVFAEPISVAPSDPADLQRATQAIADASPHPSGRRRSSGTASSRSGRPRPRRAPISSGARERCRPAGRTPDPHALAGDVTATDRRPARCPSRPTHERPRPPPARDVVARLPSARGPRLPVRRARRRPVVPAGPGPRGPGSAQPPPGLPVARRVRQGRSTGPGRRHRPEGPGTPRPLRVPPFGPLLPRGRPDAGRDARLRR